MNKHTPSGAKDRSWNCQLLAIGVLASDPKKFSTLVDSKQFLDSDIGRAVRFISEAVEDPTDPERIQVIAAFLKTLAGITVGDGEKFSAAILRTISEDSRRDAAERIVSRFSLQKSNASISSSEFVEKLKKEVESL